MTKSIDFMIKLGLVGNVKMRRVEGMLCTRSSGNCSSRLRRRTCGQHATSFLERRSVSPRLNDNIRLDEAVTQEKVLLLFEQLQTLVRQIRMKMEVEIRSIRTRDPRLSRPGFALEDGAHV